MSSDQPGLQSITAPKDQHFKKHHGIVPQHMQYKDMKGVGVTGCAQASPVLGMWEFQRAMEGRGWGRKSWWGTLDLKSFCPSFMMQVNGQNVVKVGHRQVVNMIRQGGNTLMVKVVMVTRHPDMDEAVHKKGTSSRL